MLEQKIIFNHLVEKLSIKTGCSLSVSEAFIRELFVLISSTLKETKTVKIKHIGTFSVVEGTSSLVDFIPDEEISQTINVPFAFFEPIELDADVADDILSEVDLIDDAFEEKDIISNDETENINVDESDVEDENQIINTDLDILDNVDCCVDAVEVDEISEDVIAENQNKNVEVIEEESNKNDTKKNSLIIWLSFIIGICIGYVLGCIYPYRINSNNMDNINTVNVTSSESEIAVDTLINLDSISSNVVNDAIVVTDTISNKRFLTTMAREHYGEMYFWVYIYEENKNILGNPNHIKPGTVVVIPPKSKYNIDKNNEEYVRDAKLKALQIYAPYQKEK